MKTGNSIMKQRDKVKKTLPIKILSPSEAIKLAFTVPSIDMLVSSNFSNLQVPILLQIVEQT